MAVKAADNFQSISFPSLDLIINFQYFDKLNFKKKFLSVFSRYIDEHIEQVLPREMVMIKTEGPTA